MHGVDQRDTRKAPARNLLYTRRTIVRYIIRFSTLYDYNVTKIFRSTVLRKCSLRKLHIEFWQKLQLVREKYGKT
jgi:hypothetical protein